MTYVKGFIFGFATGLPLSMSYYQGTTAYPQEVGMILAVAIILALLLGSLEGFGHYITRITTKRGFIFGFATGVEVARLLLEQIIL